MNQLELFKPLVEPTMSENATIQEKFQAFHEANPWVLQAYVQQLREARELGFPRIGIGHLTERLRWNYAAKTRDTHSKFKINNIYRSRYTRLILELHPEFKGFITLRELKTP